MQWTSNYWGIFSVQWQWNRKCHRHLSMGYLMSFLLQRIALSLGSLFSGFLKQTAVIGFCHIKRPGKVFPLNRNCNLVWSSHDTIMVLLKVKSLEEQYQHYPRASWKCRFSGPPDLLTQKSVFSQALWVMLIHTKFWDPDLKQCPCFTFLVTMGPDQHP